ncbi:hypothetical protein [Nocardioides daphniae]|uniref:hypothetical protein n=1 Tax=Nocardioides daphniae TaxID=402297 RepID=UPI001EE84D87|nr:hypothetical protein [Nocardioides daphniae]
MTDEKPVEDATTPGPTDGTPDEGTPAPVPSVESTQMLTALVQLRGALLAADLQLETPGVTDHRKARSEMVSQLEDYVIPRLMTIEAPMLAVVGGSTGAGKSTLVNSLVGHAVTTPGVLRPTTRSPVLVHHPDDGHWFGQDRLLPDLERVSVSTNDPAALQLVASESMPQGLAILDAPDIDSVEERNRTLAAQLLAAADLWLFVTSAARYADQVPWDFLREAAERSAAVGSCSTAPPTTRWRRWPPTWPGCSRPAASRTRRSSPCPSVRSRRRAAARRRRLRHPRVAGVVGCRRRGARRRRTPDPRRRDPHGRTSYAPDRRRRERAGRRPRAAADRRRPGLRRLAGPGAGGHRRRHPPAGRGARALAGVRRHR